jgi:hypothetical protein
MNIKQRCKELLKIELYYSLICIIIVSGFLLFGIFYFIPKFGVFGYFILQLFLTIAIILY